MACIPLCIPAFDPRIFTQTEYGILLDLEREYHAGWWGRLKRRRLARRDFLTIEQAAYLFSIDEEDVELFVHRGVVSACVDQTRWEDGPIVVDRESLERFLFSDRELPPPPAVMAPFSVLRLR